jgi:protease I
MARVAFIVDQMFEDSEFRQPYDGISSAGHEVVVIAKNTKESLRGIQGKESVTPDAAIGDVSADEFDALVIPGGYSPDRLRTDPEIVGFTREFVGSGRPVAAVCHAPSLLVEADVVRGRTVTSWPSVRTDLINAGANWVDREVVEDGNLITSRKPADLPAFCAAILGRIGDSARAGEPLRSNGAQDEPELDPE